MTDETDAQERRRIYDELKVPKRFWGFIALENICNTLYMFDLAHAVTFARTRTYAAHA